MKRILLILFFLASCSFSFSQERASNRLILGIGNPEIETYYQVIDFLDGLKDVKIINSCEAHRIIVIHKNASFHKDENDFLDYLSEEIDGLIVNLKNDRILNNECYEEIIKQ